MLEFSIDSVISLLTLVRIPFLELLLLLSYKSFSERILSQLRVIFSGLTLGIVRGDLCSLSVLFVLFVGHDWCNFLRFVIHVQAHESWKRTDMVLFKISHLMSTHTVSYERNDIGMLISRKVPTVGCFELPASQRREK